MRPVSGAEKNMKLTGCCADIICAINAAKGLSAGALLGAVELVLVAVVVAAGGTADVVKPADVVLDPVVAGGMYGNATPLPNTHTHDTHIYARMSLTWLDLFLTNGHHDSSNFSCSTVHQQS